MAAKFEARAGIANVGGAIFAALVGRLKWKMEIKVGLARVVYSGRSLLMVGSSLES